MREGFSIKEIEPVEFYRPEISAGFMVAQEWIKQYIKHEPRKDALFRLNIVFYELGALGKKLAYRIVAPESPRCGHREDIQTDIGDAIVQLIALSSILGIDTFSGVPQALERLQNKEWRKA